MKKLGLVAAIAAGFAGQASAELPPAVATQMATAQTDGAALAALALGVFVAIAAVKWVRRGL